MKWYKTHILTTAKFRDPDPALEHSIQAIAKNKKKDPGMIPKVPALENQKDLMKMVSILLSTGINRNDDVFLQSEVLPVRNTGAHKPVNMEHDPNKIVGHIIRTFATEKNGKRVPEGKKPKGKQFDITTESVVYSFLFPSLADDVRKRAESSELFVSVEVWFTDFDFLVGSKIVKRTHETASMLEPKLRINGGSGEFKGLRLGRVLRNMIIGGMGIVRDPANPESIIKSVSGFNSEVVQDIEDDIVNLQVVGDISEDNTLSEDMAEVEITEEPMDPTLIEEMAAVAAACDAAVAEAEAEVVETPTEATAEEGIEAQATASADLSNSPIFQALMSRLETLESDNSKLKASQKDAEFKAECSRRESELRKLGFSDEGELADILTSRSMFDMSKEQFDSYCDLLTRGLNNIGNARASADGTAEEVVHSDSDEVTEVTNESGDVSDVSTEVANEDAAEAVTEEVTAEDNSDADEDEQIHDEIEVEIEAIDPAINTKTGNTSEEPSLVDQMADVAQLFLKRNDEKWGKLALNK